MRRKSLPSVVRGVLRDPSAEVVLLAPRESPLAADLGAPRDSPPPAVREVLVVRLVVRKPPLSEVRPLAEVRPLSRGPSPAAARDVRRVPSPVRAAGLRRAWFPSGRAPLAAGVRALPPAGFLVVARGPSADETGFPRPPVRRTPPPTVPVRRLRPAPPAPLAPRGVFGFPPLAPLPLGVPGPSATLTNLQPQHYPDKRRGPLNHIGSDPLQTCPAASYSPTRSPAQYHRR